jgi:hypothetical protein
MGRQEYTIVQEKDGFWVVQKYRGGKIPKELNHRFTSHRLCEETLIRFLKSKDFLGRAIYPGCQEPAQLKSTGLS